MTPSNDLNTLQSFQTEDKDTSRENDALQLNENGRDIHDGDIVKIIRGDIKGIFMNDLAKVSYVLEPIKVRRVKGRDIAIVSPGAGASPREVRMYKEEIKQSTGELLLARVHGYTVSGEMLRTEKKVNVADVKKMPAETPLPTRKYTPPKNQHTGIEPAYGKGTFVNRPHEKVKTPEEKPPGRRRRRGES